MREKKEPVGKLFVPGRICLFGEHSDWAAEYRKNDPAIERGYTVSCGLDRGLYAHVYRRDHDFIFSSTSINGERTIFRTKMDLSVLLETAESGGFWSYIAGAVYRIAGRFSVRGLEIDNYTTDLPMMRGLGSSAAVGVLTVRAFNKAYNLGLSIREEMETAYLGEITTPSKCGRMDQGCAYGKRPIRIAYDGNEIKVEKIPVGGVLYFVIIDLGGKKDTVHILNSLRRAFSDPPGGVYKEGVYKKVREHLGLQNKQTVFKAVELLEKGDAEGLGVLMTQTQKMFDRCVAPACPSELNSPLLHRVLVHPAVKPHIFGGKGVGSHGDGSVQFVCRDGDSQKKLLAIVEKELGLEGIGFVLSPDT